MKTIAYTGLWDEFFSEQSLIKKMIHEVCQIEDTRDYINADYLLYSLFSEEHWQVPDSTIKIFYTGENITPDFNACDYAMGFDWLDFGDRYLRFPLYYLYEDVCDLMETKHLRPIEKKVDFCSMTISNANRNPIFRDLFSELSAYKKVDSGGGWNNNIGGPVDDKLSFDQTHKFSIVCENSSYPGYTTEKLIQAFAANCIPIYWGDPAVGKVFNKKSFVNVLDYHSIADVVEKVKEIDQNEALYFDMLHEPALGDFQYSKAQQTEILRNFLSNIFSSSLKESMRRNRDCRGKMYIDKQRGIIHENHSDGALSRMKNFISAHIKS